MRSGTTAATEAVTAEKKPARSRGEAGQRTAPDTGCETWNGDARKAQRTAPDGGNTEAWGAETYGAYEAQRRIARKKRRKRRRMINATALAVDVLPPLAVALWQFPIWIDRSAAATVSGCGVVLALTCCVPFLRQLRDYMKSPSAPILWCVGLASLLLLRNILDEMLAVCFVGALSNTVGMILHKVANREEE